jgi:hypothetical protein
VVTWEKNDKDAQSVDYGRITALLIEATKEQQNAFRQQQAELSQGSAPDQRTAKSPSCAEL